MYLLIFFSNLQPWFQQTPPGQRGSRTSAAACAPALGHDVPAPHNVPREETSTTVSTFSISNRSHPSTTGGRMYPRVFPGFCSTPLLGRAQGILPLPCALDSPYNQALSLFSKDTQAAEPLLLLVKEREGFCGYQVMFHLKSQEKIFLPL